MRSVRIYFQNIAGLFLLLMLPFYGSGQGIKESDGIVPYDVTRIARVTGKSLPDENFPNPNQTHEKYDVGGTDLGIAWDMGKGRTGFFFGDTYGRDFKVVKGGGPGKAGNWRSNVLAISTDNQLDDGIKFDTMVSEQIIYSPHVTDGTGSHTTIPTAAIHVNGKDYVHFMEVRKWNGPGSWSTNYSGLYESADSGKNWKECKQVRFGGLSNFGQVGYAKKDGYVYMMGTMTGRFGVIHLARFKEGDILNQAAYEYWSKTKGWVKDDESSSSPVIDNQSGELSLVYHKGYKRWIVTYLDEKKHQLVMRDASEVTGPWTEEKILANVVDYPGLYGAFIHPVSTEGNEFYFLMSMWKPYNVFLMKAHLKLGD